MTKTTFVVSGKIGYGDDLETWGVCVCPTEDEAKQLVAKMNHLATVASEIHRAVHSYDIERDKTHPHPFNRGCPYRSKEHDGLAFVCATNIATEEQKALLANMEKAHLAAEQAWSTWRATEYEGLAAKWQVEHDADIEAWLKKNHADGEAYSKAKKFDYRLELNELVEYDYAELPIVE